jgi:hypothetical protein
LLEETGRTAAPGPLLWTVLVSALLRDHTENVDLLSGSADGSLPAGIELLTPTFRGEALGDGY